jgi:hypothetical protein
MEHLGSDRYAFPVRFNIPTAICVEGSHLFRLEDLPLQDHHRRDIHRDAYAVAFVAHKDYFVYPNDHEKGGRLTLEEFREVMCRNAWLLGKIASLGIIHSAAVPLFHNRMQRDRRADGGLYEWPRGGRLDRWLDSCAYPNFGLTGIRDFEHLTAFEGSSRTLYHHLGSQLLSLFLVLGSYFRNKDRTRVGLDTHGRPIDARDLFDETYVRRSVWEIFVNYHQGFVGEEPKGDVPIDLEALTARMIDEMGVDRYMEEILRVADQQRMSDEVFRRFLRERGYSAGEAGQIKKGAHDITLNTGPHLGGFNERISLPELIESVATMAALCMLGKFRHEKACAH